MSQLSETDGLIYLQKQYSSWYQTRWQ